MGKNSIISGVIAIWNVIISCYEASYIARIIDSVCDFFKNRAKGSFFVNLFLKGFCTGEWWKNSILYKLFICIFKGSNKGILKDGIIFDSLVNLFDLQLSFIGKVVVSYAVGMGVSALIFNNFTFINGAACIFLLVVGVICILFDVSMRSLYTGSVLLKFAGYFFCDKDVEEKEPIIANALIPGLVAAFVGIISGISEPFFCTGAVMAILYTCAVFARYEIGLYSVLLLAAFLPTVAVAGLCVLTCAGFGYALLSGRVKNATPSVLAPGIMLYLLFAIFSTATSFDVPSSAFIFCVYAVFIATYFVMVNTLNTKSRYKGACACFAIGVLFIAAIGIWQNFNVSATTSSWVDSNMFEDIKTRVYATFDNPNVLGQYFIITLPLVFALFCSVKKPLVKLGWLTVFGVGFLCLIYTWSRGAWVGVMLALVIFLLIRDRRWFVLCILGLLLIPFILPESILNRILSLGNTGDSSTAYRVSVWIASYRMAIEYWMLGVGYGSDAFAAVYSNYALNGAGFALHSHNFYIQLVTDAGIGALLAFILIVLTALSRTCYTSEEKDIKNITYATVGITAGYMFQGIAESLWYNLRMSLLFWIVMAFAVCGSKIKTKE